MVSVGGVVRSFSPEKQYGFIQGEDGQSYYVHQRDVTGGVSLVVQQFVTFDPVPTPKGMRAKKVVPEPQPVLVHRDPDRFIMTRSRTVRGCIIVKVVSQHNWAESRDPNQARGLLQTIAVRAGANAIVNLELEKYTKSDACSNYRYTMHRYSGDAVIVKRPSYTTDPQVIAQSEAQMRTLAMIEAQPPLALTRMDKPPVWQFVPLLTWYWVCTVLRLGGTTCLVLVRLLLARPRRT